MKPSRRGSALLFALVILVVLSSLMVSFLFRMHLESDLTIRYRATHRARSLATAGQEYAKLLLLKSLNPGNEPEPEYEEDFFIATRHLSRGVAVRGMERELGAGRFTLHILPESGRRNINQLAEADWRTLLEETGVPDDLHDELIGAFLDWTDADDASRLHGAESDDDFYRDAGYPVKNAPIDTLNELLLIKGFTRAIVYGGPLREEYDRPDDVVRGFADLLTVYGDATLNLNAVDRDTLLTLSGLREDQIDELLEQRRGLDGLPGTEDDGFASVSEALQAARLPNDAGSLFSVGDRRWVRVVSIGEVDGVRAGTWAVYEFSGQTLTTLAFREEEIP